MIQPRWKNGKLDSTFKNRKFCSTKCYAQYSVKQNKNPSKNAGRRRAQKLYEAEKCEICHSTKNVQRHHIDGNPVNNSKVNIQILCQACHVQEEITKGTWGKPRRLKEKNCVVCGAIFRPRRSVSKLCGNPQCLVKHGKRSAALRWELKTEPTDLNPLETDRFQQWQQQHSEFCQRD